MQDHRDELAADDEWDDLEETDRYELDAEILDDLIEDDDRETVLLSTEYLHEALNVAITALAQHRPGDATLIERALAGQAGTPEFFWLN